MATLQEIETALRNADAAGDTEAAKALAQEYSRLQSSAPADRPGAIERGVRGVFKGLQDPVDAANQMVTRLMNARTSSLWWDADIKKREADYQQNVRGGQGDFDFGRMAGNMVGTAPIAAAIPAPATALGAAGLGAAGGAAVGVMQPALGEGGFLEQKAKQAGAGALGGAVAGPLMFGLSRAISPKVSPEVALLKSEGVTPTPGQAMGGAFKSAEEKLTSVPILGDAIKRAQGRTNEQFNVAAVNRALAPIGNALPKGTSGREAIKYAEGALRQSYDDALNAIGPVKLDPQMTTQMQAIYGQLAVLPKDKADQFSRIVQTEIAGRAPNGRMTPEAMKAAESNLGRVARDYMRSADFDTRQLGEAIEGAQAALREMVERQAPQGSADALRAANAGWAAFKRVQRAASYVGAEDGAFTPAQLLSAVKATDRSKDKASFVRGGALMQDLAEAGKKSIGNKTPDSGTAGRLAAGAAGAAIFAPLEVSLPAAAGLGLSSMFYTPAGQRAAAWMLTGRQGPAAQATADAVRRLGVPGALALTPAFQGLLSQ